MNAPHIDIQALFPLCSLWSLRSVTAAMAGQIRLPPLVRTRVRRGSKVSKSGSNAGHELLLRQGQ